MICAASRCNCSIFFSNNVVRLSVQIRTGGGGRDGCCGVADREALTNFTFAVSSEFASPRDGELTPVFGVKQLSEHRRIASFSSSC